MRLGTFSAAFGELSELFLGSHAPDNHLPGQFGHVITLNQSPSGSRSISPLTRSEGLCPQYGHGSGTAVKYAHALTGKGS